MRRCLTSLRAESRRAARRSPTPDSRQAKIAAISISIFYFDLITPNAVAVDHIRTAVGPIETSPHHSSTGAHAHHAHRRRFCRTCSSPELKVRRNNTIVLSKVTREQMLCYPSLLLLLAGGKGAAHWMEPAMRAAHHRHTTIAVALQRSSAATHDGLHCGQLSTGLCCSPSARLRA